MDDNLDKAKKDILDEANNLLKKGKRMNDSIVNLYDGGLNNEIPVSIWMDNPTKEEHPLITVSIENFTFSIPTNVFNEFVRAVTIADIEADKFYTDNSANIKEHVCEFDDEEEEDEE
jgi:hypothetical protein